eukprot:5481463-Prymnesium_polylepis.1
MCSTIDCSVSVRACRARATAHGVRREGGRRKRAEQTGADRRTSAVHVALCLAVYLAVCASRGVRARVCRATLFQDA